VMEATNLRYCLYARKSSESDEKQAMSIDSQLKEISAVAEREKLQIVDIKRESHSAKQSGMRPVFNELITEIREGRYDAILTWAPDRLSRNAGDLGSLVDLMDANKLQKIRTFGQSFSNSPSEKFLLMILCSQAKLENDNRGINVKRGIRTKCEMGWRPCLPPLGYYNRASGGLRDVIVDPERGPIVAEMFQRCAAGQSGRRIKYWLDSIGFTTRKGKPVTLSMIYLILKNSFFYGEFEYPKKSGNWYKGNHEPLVSKQLFNEVQKALIVPQKSKWGGKDFPFKRFLKCGSCGSTIVGEEKFKIRADGGKNRHVYYHCSRQVNYNCSEPYVKEERLNEVLLSKVDRLVLNDANVEPGLRNAIDKFSVMIRTTQPTFNQRNAFKEYAAYVLKAGTDFEKTRLVRNISSRLGIHNRTVVDLEARS